MNLIAAGAQNGLDYSGELLDSISEYSVQFAKVGLDADDMFKVFQKGAESGAFNLDKVGDAVKEFSIRAIEPGWYGTMRRVRLNRDIYDDPMDRKERLEVMFTTIAVHEMDFTSLNYYLSHAEKSLFRCQRIVNLRTERGYRALTGLVYREVTDGIRREQTLMPEELPVILKENFGIELTTEQIRYFAG